MVKIDDYDKILLDSLDKLQNLPNKSGEEGTAYFLNDKYVIKCYKGTLAASIRQTIEPYVEEVNNFIDVSGIRLPRIYTFMYKPGGVGGVDFAFNAALYLLIERVQGTALFLGENDLLADICKQNSTNHNFTWQNINLAKQGFGKDEQRAQMLYQVVCQLNDYFCQATKKLMDLPRGKMQEFLGQIVHMMAKGKHTMPDFNGGNVLVEGQDLRLIDPYRPYQNITSQNREDNVASYVYTRSIVLFEDFGKIFKCIDALKNYQVDGLVSKGQVEHINDLFKDSKDIMLAGLEYMLKQSRLSLENRKINRQQYNNIKAKLTQIITDAFEQDGCAVADSLLTAVSPKLGE